MLSKLCLVLRAVKESLLANVRLYTHEVHRFVTGKEESKERS